MARAPSQQFSCTACGSVQSKWSGRCDACGAWNTIAEDAPGLSGAARRGGAKGRVVPVTDLASAESLPPRAASGIAELDRVLGGGLVPASAILLGGDPGIGKSTLLLQAAASFAATGLRTVYVSGEEAAAQVRMRAQRLGLA
ncbi:MAG: AAA family ATPase, partial [Thermoleophilia bacterium]|nr:AAA family ATPase [Thermoleophilia bacterium]